MTALDRFKRALDELQASQKVGSVPSSALLLLTDETAQKTLQDAREALIEMKWEIPANLDNNDRITVVGTRHEIIRKHLTSELWIPTLAGIVVMPRGTQYRLVSFT